MPACLTCFFRLHSTTLGLLYLPSIACTVPLTEVYERIVFPTTEADADDARIIGGVARRGCPFVDFKHYTLSYLGLT